jgi:hypothetical protein
MASCMLTSLLSQVVLPYDVYDMAKAFVAGQNSQQLQHFIVTITCKLIIL